MILICSKEELLLLLFDPLANLFLNAVAELERDQLARQGLVDNAQALAHIQFVEHRLFGFGIAQQVHRREISQTAGRIDVQGRQLKPSPKLGLCPATFCESANTLRAKASVSSPEG